MFSENRSILFTILIVVMISIAALVGVVYSFIITLRSVDFGYLNFRDLEPDREVEVIDRGYDYNFAIPQTTTVQTIDEEAKPVEEKNEEKSDEPEISYNYNFAIPDKSYPSLENMQVPKIGFDSKIYGGSNGAQAVDKGVWQYPSNHPFDGESIFMCHRRFFRNQDPRSCWYLDRLRADDFIYINMSDGSQLSYKIESVSVREADDVNVYNTSDDNLLKLISCSIENGKIGGDTHRIVVLARLV